MTGAVTWYLFQLSRAYIHFERLLLGCTVAGSLEYRDWLGNLTQTPSVQTTVSPVWCWQVTISSPRPGVHCSSLDTD